MTRTTQTLLFLATTFGVVMLLVVCVLIGHNLYLLVTGEAPVATTAPVRMGVVITGHTSPDGAPVGVRVTSVAPAGPAMNAGIQPGDVIVQVDQTPMRNQMELVEALMPHEPGDTVTVHVTRDGERQTVSVTLERQQ